MKPNKITTRTQVYRAVYYSSFDWERRRTETLDIYTLKSKISDFIAILEHTSNGDMSDVITVKSDTAPSEKDAARLIRLLKKIERRTKDMKIVQDLVDLSGQLTEEEVK